MNRRDERSIFLEAIDVADPQQQAAFVQQACEGDLELRRNVESLLKAHRRTDGILDENPLPKFATPLEETIGLSEALARGNLDGPPKWVGSYRLMEQIGEGGFGVVYVAQQEQPVQRKVALKMIRPGMGSREVVARFEAERQALAMMDHPNIAKVFDAGVSEEGSPYFVMELVRGVSITEFCDRMKLNLQQRLELFMDVCAAVQHAHQKGVIHRDLKPSNILTTLLDDKPCVKVIDFGIAKAIGQKLTDKTVYTRFMSMMGTPLYMSPEQAELNGLDIDTRSDIYSLGVILYELLTGTTPIEKNQIETIGYPELRRLIVDKDPPKPSTRASTLGNRLSTVAADRQLDARKWTIAIRGDLDQIVMKAISKDRNQRYESAAAMARDVACYLRSEPIEARPPSAWYTASRFAKRHRVALITASLVAGSLVAGTAISVHQMFAAMHALHDKDAALQEALQAKAEATQAKQEIELFTQRLVQANQVLASARSHLEDNEVEIALEEFQSAIDLQPSYYMPWWQRGQCYTRAQQWKEAAEDFRQAIALGAPLEPPQATGIGALLLFQHHRDAYLQAARQEVSRLRSNESGTFDWQALRVCMLDAQNALSIDWNEIANAANKALNADPQARNGDRPRREGPPRESSQGGFFEGPPPRDRRPRELFEGPPQRDRHPEDPKDGPPPHHHPPGEGPDGPRGLRGVPNGMRLPIAVRQYLTGIAMLRAQRYDEAAELLQLAANDPGWNARDLAWIPLAIVRLSQGDRESAAATLDRAEPFIASSLKSSAESSDRVRNSPWFDAVEGAVLLEEARRLLLK